jgi:glycosyltransferase involved in cell wall biosynthesis
MPLISVIIPIYGVEAFIAAALQSVLDQTFQDFEVILVDDASPDRSMEICQQFTDPRLHLVRQANRGLAGARNTGIRHAQGEFLAFLDGDDVWLPEKLAQQVQHLQDHPEVGVSFCPSLLIDEAGHLTGTRLMPPLTNLTPQEFLRGNPVGNGSAPMMRRAVLDAIRFIPSGTTDAPTSTASISTLASPQQTPEPQYFDEQFRRAEDLDCWLRVTLQTPWKIEGIAEPLVLYRVNSSSLSANLYQQLAAIQQAIAKARAYAPDQVIPWEKSAIATVMWVLARSAIRLRSGKIALDLSLRAIQTHWQIILEQPQRILPTLAIALLLRLLPRALYVRVEQWMDTLIAMRQQRQLAAPARSLPPP